MKGLGLHRILESGVTWTQGIETEGLIASNPFPDTTSRLRYWNLHSGAFIFEFLQ